MLERLLKLVQAGGTYRIDDLARALDTSPELVKVMLENLHRIGYLKEMGSMCGTGCRECPLTHTRSPIAQSKVWTLTDIASDHPGNPSAKM